MPRLWLSATCGPESLTRRRSKKGVEASLNDGNLPCLSLPPHAAHERRRQDHLFLALWHSEARGAPKGASRPAGSPAPRQCSTAFVCSSPHQPPSRHVPHLPPTTPQAATAAVDGTVAVAGNEVVPSLGLAEAPRRHEREDIAEFIAKKREIFLVQMALDTKRTEIRKLEERALQREEDIKRSEEMLEADALRFDTFLKENDEKARTARTHAREKRGGGRGPTPPQRSLLPRKARARKPLQHRDLSAVTFVLRWGWWS